MAGTHVDGEQVLLGQQLAKECDVPLCDPRLEYLNWVTRRILNKDLTSGRPIDDLATESHVLRPKLFDGRSNIDDLNLEAVPTARSGHAPGDSRATDAWLVQEQPQVVPRQASESGCARQIDAKTEPVAVKLDRSFNILDEIADSDLCHRYASFVVIDEMGSPGPQTVRRLTCLVGRP
jgi:hypothetical protein